MLIALVESMIAVTQTAYLAHEMAWGCYELVRGKSHDDPLSLPAEFREGVYGAGKLIQKRDEHIEQLQELLRKLNAL
ncbi:MAG TPA: hypothetical protein VGT24_09455 [Candidatus Acidoferrales bacterium]|nr:hypothetical protein [Candidatus Acidoferrales bacterium]